MTTLPVLSGPNARPAQAPRAEGAPPMTESQRRAVAAELANAIEGEVRFGLHDRMLYATDASLYQVEPLGVVVPSGVEDAVRAVEFCARRGLPILPRGGGTSLAGQCTGRAVVMDFSAHCRAVRGLDAAARAVEVEPGITVDDLNDELARRGTGLFFAPDPATSKQANVGGCIGNNGAGSRSILYGRTSESVEAIDALVLAAGGPRRVRLERGAASRDPLVRDLTLRVAEVVRRHEDLIRARFPKTIRRNAGYALDMVLGAMDSAGPRADADEILGAVNLAHLLCGSEGTLAVTLGARLRLHPVPRAKGLGVIGFDSLDAAIDAVPELLRTRPSAVEMLDDTIIDLASANAEYARYVELMPAPTSVGAGGRLKAILYVEYFAFGEGASAAEEIAAKLAALPGLARGFGGSPRVACYAGAKEMAQAWKLRKAGEPLLHGMPGERKPITFVEDNAVPVENLARFVREFRRIVAGKGTSAAFWAHASVGVLHVRPFVSIRDENDRRIVQEIAVEVADLAASCGGVMSGEHGDGKVRGPLLERFFGPELVRAFREVKGIFDPGNLLNPGNLVEPGPVASIVERVRVKPEGAFVDVPGVETFFDYADQHGFRGAVEMCNGAGVCRKKTGGTMCPSYMATLDERHSTRGRGNALRLAITGQLGAGAAEVDSDEPVDRPPTSGAAWDDTGTIGTLHLCLSCKACKAECPSNVDIARLKAEYTAQRYRSRGGAPLSARVFGHVRTLNRLGAAMPGVANWVNRQPWARAVIDGVLGISPRRSIPEFARPLSSQWRVEGELERGVAAGAPRVAVYMDCFTGYNEPQIGLATRRVLERFGYRVELIDAGCCGRAMISTGLLEDARAAIDAGLERLRGAVQDPGIEGILVCEPSCLSAIKDDWLQLKVRTPLGLRKALAARSFLPEEFLDKRWDRHPARPEVRPGAEKVLLHAHCHQKALWGAESSANLLKRLVGERLSVLDSGCCGMAGSFGYTADRYELSMKIGELSLFPAVRKAGEGCAVVAPGTSCRHQIHDGTGARALHPMELVDRLLAW